jgi:hypothetical protein
MRNEPNVSEKEMRESSHTNSDLRLMELADRNPSLGGRELLREIIERGPTPEEVERPQPRDVRAALRITSFGDPDYRTRAEQADWIGNESKMMRDLYERGAEIKGDVLIIPAEEHELPEDRQTPFITTLSYALERIGDAEKAAEFHSLARRISGDTADARMQIVVFSAYYDRIGRDKQRDELEREKALARTLDEMREIAVEMEKLETRESIEATNADESREDDHQIRFNDSARKVRLTEESLRFPAGLTYEARERLVSVTIPEIDRRLEGGVTRAMLFAAIDGSANRRDGKGAQESTERERLERAKAAGFLKSYIDERLRDPETRALHRSAEFRQARAEFIAAKTPEALGRAAETFLRINLQRSESLRRYLADPDHHPRPDAAPLNPRERNLLFNGRAPDHHTREMRELRINYGFSRLERAARTEKLHQGLLEPSQSLKLMVEELETRKTAKAISHFQASLLNERMNNEGKLNLNTLYNRIPPHERAYLYELSEGRKQSVLKTREQNHQKKILAPSVIGRAFGAMPKESGSLREYLASMGQIERRLLNEELRRLKIKIVTGEDRDGLTITEARSLLPEQTARGIRAHARDLAWERIAPAEAFASAPPPEAVRISDTIAHIQEHLQERARIAQNARDEFLAEKIRDAELRLGDRGGTADRFASPKPKEEHEKFVQSVIASLAPEDARKLAALDHYAARTREEVYRGFEAIDSQRRNLELALARSETRPIENYDSLRMIETRSQNQAPVFAHSGQPVSRLASQVSGTNERLDHGSRSDMNFARGSVDSDREWRFDSLRQVLSFNSFDNQIATERSDQLNHVVERDIASQR